MEKGPPYNVHKSSRHPCFQDGSNRHGDAFLGHIVLLCMVLHFHTDKLSQFLRKIFQQPLALTPRALIGVEEESEGTMLTNLKM